MEALDRGRARIQNRIAHLRSELSGLEKKLIAYDAVIEDIKALGDDWIEAVGDSIPISNAEVKGMTRPDAVLWVMRTHDPPGNVWSPPLIVDILHLEGRDNDNTHNVGNTLTKLKKEGRVVNRGYGKWVLSDQDGPGDRRIGDLLGVEGSDA